MERETKVCFVKNTPCQAQLLSETVMGREIVAASSCDTGAPAAVAAGSTFPTHHPQVVLATFNKKEKPALLTRSLAQNNHIVGVLPMVINHPEGVAGSVPGQLWGCLPWGRQSDSLEKLGSLAWRSEPPVLSHLQNQEQSWGGGGAASSTHQHKTAEIIAGYGVCSC